MAEVRGQLQVYQHLYQQGNVLQDDLLIQAVRVLQQDRVRRQVQVQLTPIVFQRLHLEIRPRDEDTEAQGGVP